MLRIDVHVPCCYPAISEHLPMREIETLDLNLLRVFEALMLEQNVSHAAARLHLTQSAASNALNRLRRVCNDRLFVRTRHGMQPTPLALALYDPIQRALALVKTALLEGLSFDPLTSNRSFTIIATDVAQVTVGAQLSRALSRQAPNIDLQFMEAAREEYEKLLDSGEADLAYGHFSISSSFRRELVGSCIYVAVLCAKYAKKLKITQGGIFPLEDFVAAAHVEVVPRNVAQNPIAAALRAHAPLRRVALRVPHISGLYTILPGTELVATVPQPVVPVLCSRGALTWAMLPFETGTTEVFLGWHKRHDGDKSHIWIREAIRSIRLEYTNYPSVAGHRVRLKR
jgi:DNA-binding transcriptional LysR family regulator